MPRRPKSLLKRHGASILSRDHPLRVRSTTTDYNSPEPRPPLQPDSKHATFSAIRASQTVVDKTKELQKTEAPGVSIPKQARFRPVPGTVNLDAVPAVGAYSVRHGERFTKYYRKLQDVVNTNAQRFDYLESNSEDPRETMVERHTASGWSPGEYNAELAKQRLMPRPSTVSCDVIGRDDAPADEMQRRFPLRLPTDTPLATQYATATGGHPLEKIQRSSTNVLISKSSPLERDQGYAAQVGLYSSTSPTAWVPFDRVKEEARHDDTQKILAASKCRSVDGKGPRAATACFQPCTSVLAPWLAKRGSRCSFGFGSGVTRFSDNRRLVLDTQDHKATNMLCNLGVHRLSDRKGNKQTFQCRTDKKGRSC